MFYSCKAIWKKTQEFGLLRNFKDLPDVNELVRRAAALPLLPLDKVENYWLHTLEDAPDREDCTKLTIDLERRQIPTINMEPLPARGTQNQQPSRGLTQQNLRRE